MVVCNMAAKKRNPVSEYLAEIGRRGGEVKSRKGLAAMDPERRKEIARQGVEARQKKASKRGAREGGKR